MVRTLIAAAGRFGSRQAIAEGREPRLDIDELSRELSADVIDFSDVDRSTRSAVRLAQRLFGDSPALAALAAAESARYDAVLTTGEDIGIPLAMLMAGRRRPTHTMIAHTLAPWKKRVFFHLGGAGRRIDRILCYATSEERHIIDRLSVPAGRVRRLSYHADQRFFHPMPEVPVERDLVVSAGQLLRDYDTLLEACRDLPVRVRIAAGSPWISKELQPDKPLPANAEWSKYDRFDLRNLYARAAMAVVPIYQNDYQTGISTILEMMAMGKCVIATRTRGQTDTIVDKVNGLYVPPSDAGALREAIRWVLEHPVEAAGIGARARAFIEKEASLELFTARIAETVRTASGPS